MNKIAWLVILLSVFIATSVFANDVDNSGPVTCISSFTEDWCMAKPQKIVSVIFNPGAVDDKVFLRSEDASTGAAIALIESGDGKIRHLPFYGSKIKLAIDYSESTLSSGAFVSIVYAR